MTTDKEEHTSATLLFVLYMSYLFVSVPIILSAFFCVWLLLVYVSPPNFLFCVFYVILLVLNLGITIT